MAFPMNGSGLQKAMNRRLSNHGGSGVSHRGETARFF